MSQPVNILLAELSNRINTYLVENQTGDITATKHKAIETKSYETLAQLAAEIDGLVVSFGELDIIWDTAATPNFSGIYTANSLATNTTPKRVFVKGTHGHIDAGTSFVGMKYLTFEVANTAITTLVGVICDDGAVMDSMPIVGRLIELSSISSTAVVTYSSGHHYLEVGETSIVGTADGKKFIEIGNAKLQVVAKSAIRLDTLGTGSVFELTDANAILAIGIMDGGNIDGRCIVGTLGSVAIHYAVDAGIQYPDLPNFTGTKAVDPIHIATLVWDSYKLPKFSSFYAQYNVKYLQYITNVQMYGDAHEFDAPTTAYKNLDKICLIGGALDLGGSNPLGSVSYFNMDITGDWTGVPCDSIFREIKNLNIEDLRETTSAVAITVTPQGVLPDSYLVTLMPPFAGDPILGFSLKINSFSTPVFSTDVSAVFVEGAIRALDVTLGNITVTKVITAPQDEFTITMVGLAVGMNTMIVTSNTTGSTLNITLTPGMAASQQLITFSPTLSISGSFELADPDTLETTGLLNYDIDAVDLQIAIRTMTGWGTALVTGDMSSGFTVGQSGAPPLVEANNTLVGLTFSLRPTFILDTAFLDATGLDWKNKVGNPSPPILINANKVFVFRCLGSVTLQALSPGKFIEVGNNATLAMICRATTMVIGTTFCTGTGNYLCYRDSSSPVAVQTVGGTNTVTLVSDSESVAYTNVNLPQIANVKDFLDWTVGMYAGGARNSTVVWDEQESNKFSDFASNYLDSCPAGTRILCIGGTLEIDAHAVTASIDFSLFAFYGIGATITFTGDFGATPGLQLDLLPNRFRNIRVSNSAIGTTAVFKPTTNSKVRFDEEGGFAQLGTAPFIDLSNDIQTGMVAIGIGASIYGDPTGANEMVVTTAPLGVPLGMLLIGVGNYGELKYRLSEATVPTNLLYDCTSKMTALTGVHYNLGPFSNHNMSLGLQGGVAESSPGAGDGQMNHLTDAELAALQGGTGINGSFTFGAQTFTITDGIITAIV